MRGRIKILLMLCSIIILGSCGTNQFQLRKNFHSRIAIPIEHAEESKLNSCQSDHPDLCTDNKREQLTDHIPYKREIKPVQTKTIQSKPVNNQLTNQTLHNSQWNHQFKQYKILKVNDVKKTNDEGTGLWAIILGALAIMFLLTGFALFHVSISLFVAFWAAGLKLSIYGAIAGIMAVADDDDTMEIIGCIVGCLAVLLAFALIIIVFL